MPTNTCNLRYENPTYRTCSQDCTDHHVQQDFLCWTQEWQYHHRHLTLADMQVYEQSEVVEAAWHHHHCAGRLPPEKFADTVEHAGWSD